MPLALRSFALSTYHTMSEVEALGRQEFVFACQEIRDRILDRLDDYGRLLKGGAALFDTFDAITREDWHTFVSRQDVERQYQGYPGNRLRGGGFPRKT